MTAIVKSGSSLGRLWMVAALSLQTSAMQLFNTTPSGVPVACGDALTTNITCNQLVPVPVIVNQQDSLYQIRNAAESACGTDVYSFSGVNQTVQSFLDPLTWAYNVSCLTSGEEFCYSDIMNRNTSIQPCSDCFLQYEAAMLGSTYGRQRIDPVAFSSLLSSCSVPASKYPYSTPTALSATLPSTTVIAVAACTGTTYTVESTDTCRSISSVHNIATDRFVTENHLDSNCTTLSTGDDVCLGASCTLRDTRTIHTACDNIDTMIGKNICLSLQMERYNYQLHHLMEFYVCPSADIVSNFGNFTLTQFYTWNPAIGTNCKHLDVDDAACIGVPGASTVTATSAAASTTTTTNAAPSPLMPDTDDTCDSIEEAYSITSDQFSEWNPYVSNGTDCQHLWLNTYICVGAPDSSSSDKDSTTTTMLLSTTTTTQTATVTVPSPLTPSTDADCTKYHYVVDDEDCETIESQYRITAAQFNSWNPYVGSGCASLWLHYYVCVGV
ncbi:uncharacterized protein N7483_012447 [Penicillium malachiteum]|uniref:uncharacterized protein n=1 Tax=Penicillium malachiteum TaxID=1324776 RepID=UPI002547B4A8|nr:uncharacterized protein N7483_012447 [Penicillium malachiteum]KAJ5715266.1 hypothetical protein N7483_012447 [Penicillium malachiteum]